MRGGWETELHQPSHDSNKPDEPLVNHAAESLLSIVRDLDARARVDLERATESLAVAQEHQRSAALLAQFLDRLSGHLSRGESSEALRLANASDKQRQILEARSPDFAKRLRCAILDLQDTVATQFSDLLRSFPDGAREAGLKLDASSRHPNYSLAQGFIRVEFDKSRLETRVLPRDGKKNVLGIDVPVVTKLLASEFTRLFLAHGDPNDFAKELVDAYKTAITEAGCPGDNLEIRSVTSVMSRQKTFNADEFNVNLSLLVRSKLAAELGLRLDHTRQTKNGILLWQLDDRGYVGYISLGIRGDASDATGP